MKHGCVEHMIFMGIWGFKDGNMINCSSAAKAWPQVQVMWRLVKQCIRTHATKGDKILPFLLKFRDIVERIAHHLMVERLVACSEARTASFQALFHTAGLCLHCIHIRFICATPGFHVPRREETAKRHGPRMGLDSEEGGCTRSHQRVLQPTPC